MTIAGEGHTPLPWQVVGTPFGEGFTILAQPHAALRGFTKAIAFVGDKSDAETEANARLIVTAVNALPKLVEALEEAKKLAKLAESLTGCRADDDYVWSVQAKIDSALASLQSKDTDNV